MRMVSEDSGCDPSRGRWVGMMPRNPGCAARPGANGCHPFGMEKQWATSPGRCRWAVELGPAWGRTAGKDAKPQAERMAEWELGNAMGDGVFS
jgi:hypothetical protein